MKSQTLLLASLSLALGLGAPTALHAQEGDGTQEDDRIADLEQEVANLGAAYEELMELYRELHSQVVTGAGGVPSGDEFYIPRQAAEFEEAGLPQNMGSIYTKPFLADFGQSAHVGGYIDLEFLDESDGSSREFDQHRLVPFIYADVSERVKVAAEVEIEHGSELEVEFAQMDFLFNDYVNLRAGIQLLPLGKLNEVHDSPIQELTFRPLVNRYIIPTTLRDAGLGVWGDISESVSYQATITNGFKGLRNDGSSAINNSKGLRDAAPQADELASEFENIDNHFAYTGRVAVSPVLGIEAGISALFDTYDERANNDLTIVALDATINGKAVPGMPDNMELLYEGAWADIERDEFAKANDVAGDMTGHYVQANFHFVPGFLEECINEGGFAEEGSRFTFVTRYGNVDLDDYTMRRTTFGLNFRPNEAKTVWKLDYLSNDDNGANKGDANANAWALSFASYF